MNIDHIFIFSKNQGEEAEELRAFGLSEGSSRVHPGQGTTNRKFYFENFFLEILWVHDEAEARSGNTKAAGLGHRAQHPANGASPFGLCLVNTTDTDPVFRTAHTYQPQYFPEGMAIDVANVSRPQLPWTFRLPFKGKKQHTEEPTKHTTVLQQLTKATFGIPSGQKSTDFVRYFDDEGQICWEEKTDINLVLEFDGAQQGKRRQFDTLPLQFLY